MRYRPTELRHYLDQLGVDPKKSLSQNFLIDGNIVRKIVALANVKASDTVLEIGPGPGALTEALLGTGAQVIAVEKDNKLGAMLLECDNSNRLTVHCEDFLEFDLFSRVPAGTKVAANLPYQITMPILSKLLPTHGHIQSVTVMVQDEVARRLIAPAGSRVYGSSSVFVQFYAKASYGFTVSHNCFMPAPKVESAVIHLTLHKPPYVPDREAFFTMVRTAFGQRRKQLQSTLKTLYSLEILTEACAKASIDLKERPEQLSVERWVALANALPTQMKSEESK